MSGLATSRSRPRTSFAKRSDTYPARSDSSVSSISSQIRCRLPSIERGRVPACSRPESRLASHVRSASAQTSSGSRPDSRAARAVAHKRSGESPRCARRVAFFNGPEMAARSTTSIEWAIATSTRALPRPRDTPACAIRAASTACVTRSRVCVRGAFGSDHSLHQKCIASLQS